MSFVKIMYNTEIESRLAVAGWGRAAAGSDCLWVRDFCLRRCLHSLVNVLNTLTCTL